MTVKDGMRVVGGEMVGIEGIRKEKMYKHRVGMLGLFFSCW